MNDAYIALGANLGKPTEQLTQALACIAHQPKLQLLDYSALYSSRPLGPQDQPDYVNAVCHITSQLTALETLQLLHQIEDDFGRQRLRHWGERTLDLDLLLFGQQQSSSEQLRLPHPGLYQREFVLYPLKQIAADLQLPNGKTVAQQCTHVTQNGLTVIFSRSSIKRELVGGAHYGSHDHC